MSYLIQKRNVVVGDVKYYVLRNRKTGQEIHYTGSIKNKPSGWTRISGPHYAPIIW